MAQTVSGGVIDIEYSDDISDPETAEYTVAGKTRGTVSYDPNTDIAESDDDHSSRDSDKAAVGRAWEMEFESKVLSTLGGMETLGLYEDGEVKDSVDVRPADDAGLRVTVYKDESAQEDGDHLLQFGPQDDFLLELDSLDIEPDGFSAWEAAIHIRQGLKADIEADE